tara:strand:+ start:209 stop:352 length:144 start_codon:yes stop_codon:yes gene_type:complete
MPRRRSEEHLSKNKDIWGKIGRPPKGWTPPIEPILKSKKGKFVITFD